MALSPQGIRDTTFKSVRRGFDPDEVEAFVEDVAAALESAQNDATAMEAKARAAVARLQELSRQGGDSGGAAAPPSAVPVESPEFRTDVDEAETISRTLLLAQRTADTTVADAQAEADRLLAAARDDAAASLDNARVEAASLVEAAKVEARRAGEAERVQVEGEVQALLARRDFLESDVDHLEQYLVAQRERIVEAVASLSDLVHRVPGGLADMRRPLLSAAADLPHGDAPHDAGAAPADPVDAASIDGPTDAGPGDGDPDEIADGDEIAEITRVASADQEPADATPRSGTPFAEDGEPTQQLSAIDARDRPAD